jgi:hypothetical protein
LNELGIRVRGGRRFASSGHDDPGREQMQAIVSTIGRAALRKAAIQRVVSLTWVLANLPAFAKPVILFVLATRIEICTLRPYWLGCEDA